MKISVLGYSGSGKSTLAKFLGEKYHADVLHFDAIHWLPGWQQNTPEEKLRLTAEFLDSHDSWVIDGNYSKYYLERRLEESDKIILMLFGRIPCLIRVIKRYFTYKGRTRPDMGEDCPERLDWEFLRYVAAFRRENRQKLISALYAWDGEVIFIRNKREYRKFLLTLRG